MPSYFSVSNGLGGFMSDLIFNGVSRLPLYVPCENHDKQFSLYREIRYMSRQPNVYCSQHFGEHCGRRNLCHLELGVDTDMDITLNPGVEMGTL